MKEEWRDVEGWEGLYQVSDRGRVRSRTRKVLRRGKIYGRIMQLSDHWRGYKVVWLRRHGHVHKKYFVHRLVAIAFIPLRGGDFNIVNHKDGVRTNNVVSNLEWMNHQENVTHGNDRRAAEESEMPF